MYCCWGSLALLSWVELIFADIYYGDFYGRDYNSKSLTLTESSLPNGICEHVVKGRGVNDKLLEKCSKKNSATMISSDNYCAAYYPDNSPFGLYTDTYGTLAMIKPEGCMLRTYKDGNFLVQSALSNTVCGKIKQKLTDEIKELEVYWRKWETNFRRKMKGLPPAEIIFNPLQSQPSTPSLYADQRTFLDGATEKPTSLPERHSPQSIVPVDSDPLQEFKVTYPFRLDDRGKYSNTYKMTLSTNINSFNVKGCYYYILAKGFGINDHYQEACNKEKSTAVSTKEFMSYGTPTSPLGLFSETPNVLIILKKGTCYKKTFGDSPSRPTLVGVEECENIKRRMKERLNTNDKASTGDINVPGDKNSADDSDKEIQSEPWTSIPTNDEPSQEPKVTWQSGSYRNTFRPRISVTVDKDIDSANKCTMRVSFVGRGINERITDSCSVLGENLLKKVTSYSFAFGDPTTNSGFYTENWSGLVVIRNGKCTYRSYESSPITNLTKSTPRAMSRAECASAMSRLATAIKRK